MLTYFLQLLSSIFEIIRGSRTVREITEPRAHLESLVGYSIDGYTTTIHCQERKYLCTYSRWPIFNKVVQTYFVFATVNGPAPQVLVRACSIERSFPKLLVSWMDSDKQKEAAIEAYIDLLIDHLKSNNALDKSSFAV